MSDDYCDFSEPCLGELPQQLRVEADNHNEGLQLEVLLRVAADEIERLWAAAIACGNECLEIILERNAAKAEAERLREQNIKAYALAMQARIKARSSPCFCEFSLGEICSVLECEVIDE
jgi:hypothetical protein